MPLRTVSLFVVSTGIWFAGAHLTRAQEATSANLPDQFQTGEMIQIHKPKKKKSEPNSQTVAIATKQDAAAIPDQPAAPAEGLPTQLAPAKEKKSSPTGILPQCRQVKERRLPPNNQLLRKSRQ